MDLFFYEAKKASIAIATARLFNEMNVQKSVSKRIGYFVSVPKCSVSTDRLIVLDFPYSNKLINSALSSDLKTFSSVWIKSSASLFFFDRNFKIFSSTVSLQINR